MPSQPLTPTTELDAINIMLSAIGEAPINSLAEVTADVSVARNILAEVCKEIQLEGWQWNTEDDYPLTPDISGLIKLHPSIVRVHFREPDDRELIVRGNQVYNRGRHTYTFPQDTKLLVTITLLLPFEQLPESARRYTTIKALRVYQERIVGSDTLAQFHAKDEARARAIMQAEERRLDRPNMLTGTMPPGNTWRPITAFAYRGPRRWR